MESVTPPVDRSKAGSGSAAARVAVVALAAFLRLWQLELRPPHFDEGVFGLIADDIRQIGYYPYNPGYYHGPLLHYVLFGSTSLLGRNLWALRLPEALAGILLVDWIFRFERFYGARVCLWTALAIAVSPAYVFFSRYAIQETWFTLFMIVAAWGVLGLLREHARAYLWAAGMGLTGMILIKETYLVHLICLLAAIPITSFLERVQGPIANGSTTLLSMDDRRPEPARAKDVAAVTAVALIAILFFYSGNGRHVEGLAAMAASFAFWAHTAGAHHSKPFQYFLELFLRNEPWAVCGLVVGLRYVLLPTPLGRPLRLLAVYAYGTLFAYSVISYKTPWCVPAFAWPFFFLASVAVSTVPVARRTTATLMAFAAASSLMVYSAWLSLDLNFRRYTDPTEDYVYFHTFEDVSRITTPLYALGREDASNYLRRGLVIYDQPHPVPWLLADFSKVEYYPQIKRLPDYDADFLIVSEPRDRDVESTLKGDFFKETFSLRPGVAPITLYLRYSVFSHLLPGRDPEFRSGSGAR